MELSHKTIEEEWEKFPIYIGVRDVGCRQKK
jgi:hypothetical protein